MRREVGQRWRQLPEKVDAVHLIVLDLLGGSSKEKLHVAFGRWPNGIAAHRRHHIVIRIKIVGILEATLAMGGHHGRDNEKAEDIDSFRGMTETGLARMWCRLAMRNLAR